MSNKYSDMREQGVRWFFTQIMIQQEGILKTELKGRNIDLDARLLSYMITIFSEEGLTQREVGERTGEVQSTVSRGIDELESRGLVSREKDPRSRRAHRLRLTDEGLAAIDDVFPVIKFIEQETLAPLEPVERKELLRLLKKLTHV